MCKTLLNKKDDEIKSEVENSQPTKHQDNYNAANSMHENVKEDSLGEQTYCFVLGYN